MSRTSRALGESRLRGVLLAAPAVLLAVGWALAANRESTAAQARRRQSLAASANAVVAAAREGLEELRAREDERPYYHYAYYFTPPEVIAVQESVAVSPLGSVPRDPRVRGHFQVDPGPVLQLPLEHPEAPARSRDRAHELRRALEGPLTARLAAMTQAPRAPQTQAQQTAAANQRVANLDNNWTNTVQQQNAYSNEVLADIRGAQSGARDALARTNLRGRAPARPRVDVNYRGEPRSIFGSLSSAPGAINRENPERASADGEVRSRDGTTAEADADPRSAPVVRDVGDAALYTPMAFHRDDAGTIYLVRTVTTSGATSAQGALLDREALFSRWLDAVVRRHGALGVGLSIATSTECASGAFAYLPAPLDDRGVCAVERAQGPQRFRVEWLAIAGTLALVLAAGAARGRALRRAEELAETERAFVASVSHELRTPLTTLRMHAEMLAEGWVSDERKPRVMQQLVDESTRLARLIEDVLTFGRLADGRAQLVLVEADLRARVRSIVEREAPRLLERGLDVRLVGAPDGEDEHAPVRARFDETALEQVLLNLLENAARYGRVAPQGENAEPSPCEVCVCARGSAQVVLRVRDRGRGVAPRERAQVFERFYRTPDAVKSHVAGTGLGLAIVRGLARAMSGDARIVDPGDGGPGCAIEVTLPASPADADAAPAPTKAPTKALSA